MSEQQHNFCPACRQELPGEVHFCGFCGFHLSPMDASEYDSLSQSLEPLADNGNEPILLTKVKQVEGQVARLSRGAEQAGEPPAGRSAPARRRKPTLELVEEEPPPPPPPRTGPRRSRSRPQVPLSGRAAVPVSDQPAALFPPVRGPAAREPGAPGIDQGWPVPATLPVADTSAPQARDPHPDAPLFNIPRGRRLPTVPSPAEVEDPTEQSCLPSGDRSERRYRRFPLQVEVGYATDHNFYTGFIVDISSGGLFVATHSPEEIGTVVEMSFTVPGLSRTCTTICQVQWIREYNSITPDTIPGMGLRFVKLDREARAAIEMFIKHRDPLFFEE